ncbi:MAG: hypothetical protein IKP12_05510, partial [Acholeplasmatales bacterium]|nr:hypothetical protein [Acholeplasmatales bacterium]
MKKYNSFLDFSVGGISLKINLSSVNKDLFFITPLTLQIGRMPLNLNILYSHNNQNEIENFGKGIRSSLYKRIEQLSDCCNVYNSDFSVDRYDIVDSYNYKNIETQNILYRDQSSYYAYRIKDKEGNKIEYEAGSSNYFKAIKIIGKAEYSITYPNNQIVYKNSFNDSLTLNIINNKVNTCYYRDSDSQDILFETNLSYDNQDRLSGISVKKGNDYIRNETINYGSNSYEIIDNISGNKIVVTINSSSTLIEEYFLSNLIGSTTITYYNNKTKVINSLGQELIYFFDNKGICVTTLNDNMAQGVIYHNDYKLPTFVSNEFRVEGADLNFLDLNDFITDVNKTAYSISNIDINLQNKMINPYMISGSGNTYSIVNREGTSNDYLSFLLWVKVVSAEVNSRFYIELMVNDVIKRIYINNLDISTTYRLISVGIRPTKKYNSVRMLIYIYNATLIIGGLQLLNKGFGTAYTYDASGNLIEAQDKYGTT